MKSNDPYSHYIIHNLYFMYMIWSTKNKPFRDCSLWYRGCYAIGWAIEGCPGKGILDNPHIYTRIYTFYHFWLMVCSRAATPLIPGIKYWDTSTNHLSSSGIRVIWPRIPELKGTWKGRTVNLTGIPSSNQEWHNFKSPIFGWLSH